MKINLSKPAPENCPSWEKCGTNSCPLHEAYHKTLWDLPEDKEIIGWRKCRASKKVRMQIGKAFNLPHLGLKEKEFAGYLKWKNMSESEREAKKQELRENSPFLRLKAKGYGIVRVKEKELNFTLTNEPKTLTFSEKKPISEPNKPSEVEYEAFKEKMPEKEGDIILTQKQGDSYKASFKQLNLEGLGQGKKDKSMAGGDF